MNRDLGERACREIRSTGGRCEFVQCDITSEASLETAFGKAGAVNIVINSAGIVGPNAIKTADVAAEDFDRTYRVNLFGSFLVTKHALRAMGKSNRGRILLIASIAGKEGNAGMSAYSSTKAGVIGFVKSVGKEYAETGITVNGLAPAVIRTALVENMNPDQVKYMTDKIPMKRCGTLDEIAAVASWIVSDESSFITGFTFDMSGGRAVY
jgi:3-oxoacyl-[acyl-carrier protein] reductase